MEEQLERKDYIDMNSSACEEDYLDIKNAAERLSVSTATVRNWIKLGRLQPVSFHARHDRKIRFRRTDIDQVVADIISGKSDKLTKRRNKKAVKGVDLYTDYIQDSGNNILIGAELVKNDPSVFSEECIRVILADLAVKLYFTKNGRKQAGLLHFLSEKDENRDDQSFLILLSELLDGADCGKYEAITSKIAAPVFIPYQDFLGFIYISISKIANRKSTGAYFTPISVVEQLLDNLCAIIAIQDKKLIDPCCGTGNFLLAALQRGAHFSNLYGRDLDAISSCVTKINLFLNGISDLQLLNSHITTADSLLFDFSEKFDIVLGNPPWGYVYTKQEIQTLMKTYATASPHGTESYDLFLEKSIRILESDGILAYVLPEALLNVRTHLEARKIIQKECSIAFVDYIGNAFTQVVCPCIILGLRKDGKGKTTGCVVTHGDQQHVIREERNLTEEYWNFSLSDEDAQCIDKISSVNHAFTLKGKADFALGIVTGSNKEYISDKKMQDCEMVLRGSDLHKFWYQPSGNFIRFEPKNFQQVAPTQYYRAPEKLIYRFICGTPVFSYDNHQTLSLNSANILIPHVDGMDMKYILAILNSQTISYWCRKKYNSVKLLRSHIESIPFPTPSKNMQNQIIDIVTRLIHAEELGFEERKKIYDSLEEMIMTLYQLDAPSRQLIKKDTEQFDAFL